MSTGMEYFVKLKLGFVKEISQLADHFLFQLRGWILWSIERSYQV
jgi:hypothetical protein